MSSDRDYVKTLFAAEDDSLRWAQEQAEANGLPSISLDADEGRTLQVLAKAAGARKALEIGALGGYSGIWIARALPADGHLFTLEVSSKHAQVARASYERAGVADRVTLIEGAALDTLPKLAKQAPFDLVFLDADANNYTNYLRYVTDYLRPGGLLTMHNALEGQPDSHSARQPHFAAFNQAIANSPDFTSTILPFGAGFLVAVKNG